MSKIADKTLKLFFLHNDSFYTYSFSNFLCQNEDVMILICLYFVRVNTCIDHEQKIHTCFDSMASLWYNQKTAREFSSRCFLDLIVIHSLGPFLQFAAVSFLRSLTISESWCYHVIKLMSKIRGTVQCIESWLQSFRYTQIFMNWIISWLHLFGSRYSSK